MAGAFALKLNRRYFMQEYETIHKGCSIWSWTDGNDGEIIVSVNKPNWLGIGLPKLGFSQGGFDNHTAAIKFAKRAIDDGDKWKPIMRLYSRPK